MKKRKYDTLTIINWVFLFMAMLGFVCGFLNDPDNLFYRILFLVGLSGFVIILIVQLIIKKVKKNKIDNLGSKKDDN